MKAVAEGKKFTSLEWESQQYSDKRLCELGHFQAEVPGPYMLYKPISGVPKAQQIQAEKSLWSLFVNF